MRIDMKQTIRWTIATLLLAWTGIVAAQEAPTVNDISIV